MALTPPKKGNNKQQKRRFRRFKTTPASKLASSFLTAAMRAKGFAQAEVVTRWPHIVGAELAAVTVPQRLLFPRGEKMGAKLVVRCESAFAPLLQAREPLVIDMVNRFFGYGAVAKIEIKQGPLKNKRREFAKEKRTLSSDENRKLSDIVGNGELSPLQEAVKSLGEMVLSNQKDKD